MTANGPPPPDTPADPRLAAASQCVARACLARRAASDPDAVFAVFACGETWSYGQLHARVRAVAAGLQRLGVRPGDSVLAWLPNGPEALLVLFAANWLGAVFAPISVESRGALLHNALVASGARVAVAHGRLLPRLAAQDASLFEHVVVVGPAAGDAPLPGRRDFVELARCEAVPDEGPLPPQQPWDVHALVATSGTTGASKFVPITYAQTWATSGGFVALEPRDRALMNLPVSHVGGLGIAYRALYRGGSVAVVESFSAAEFWSTVRRLGVTTLTLLGAMTDFLLAEPEGDADRDHPLRHVIMVPIGARAETFARRFGVDVYTVFNMTEVSCPIVSGRNVFRLGSCGRAREGYELRLVDEHDCEVPRGALGELVLRADAPWAIATRYKGDPRASALAWRNGWFHTGDRFRQDDDGHFHFVDRVKDAIRRRGENVSAVEVESAIAGFGGIREVAVVGVPAAQGEEDVLAAISVAPGRQVDRTALVEHLVERLPHFMVPRYLRFVAELPKTTSMKIMKTVLRQDGVTADTWDREADGLRLRRTRFDDPHSGHET